MVMTKLATPLYSPLDRTKSEIRLLTIENDAGQPISCRLETVSFSQAPPYTALSYVWGDETVKRKILLDGKEVPVTTNLAAALRYVKGHWSNFYPGRDATTFRIWIDALCINQDDFDEKGQQVQLMRSIYSNAELVLAWLGIGTDQIMLALDSLKKISATFGDFFDPVDHILDESVAISSIIDRLWRLPELSRTDGSIDQASPNKTFAAFRALSDLSYWSRAWALQETVQAKTLLLCCAETAVDFVAAEHSVQIIDKIQSDSKHPPPSFIEPDAWNSLLFETPTLRPLDNIRTQKRLKFLNESTPEGKVSRTLFLFYKSPLFEASNAKDYVYAFLGLSQLDVVPEYADSTPEYMAYVAYARAWIRLLSDAPSLAVCRKCGAGHLTFLEASGVGYFTYPSSFPTWVPNYPDMDRTGHRFWLPSRQADEGLPEDVMRDVQIDGVHLVAWGLQLQYIQAKNEFSNIDVEDAAYFFLRFIGIFCHKNSSYITGIPPLRAAMEILRRGAVPPAVSELFEDLIALVWMAAAAAFRRSGKGHWETSLAGLVGEVFDVQESEVMGWLVDKFFSEAQLEEMGRESTIQKLANGSKVLTNIPYHFAAAVKIQGLAHYHCIFSTEDGYIGLCPKNSKVDDLVCVLAGCRMPVVLRRQDTHYLHVGTCFVLGLMDGEAAELVGNSKRRMQKFEIH
ncbi:hypothetical protein V2A60_007298 [Cordyceps javanica]